MTQPTGSPATGAPDSAADSLLGRLADEFLEARQRDAPLDIETLAADHPQAADVIRRTFPALAALRQAPAASLPAEELGDFRLVRELGRGGMGVVYEAVQQSLGRRVALKVLPLAAMLDQRRLRRFHREAQAAAALQHPHIVPVYGSGCERGVHYYAMQLVRGVSLAEAITRFRDAGVHPRDASTERLAFLSTLTGPAQDRFHTIAGLAIQAADALAYAHGEGVIHRDVKPSNLLLDEHGQLWISDFGLAQFQADAGLTQTGDVVGTLRYMSPEQLTGQQVLDQRTDVYSLGLTLYAALAGQEAFAGVPREQLAQHIILENPAPLRRLDPTIPLDLETIVVKAIAKDRDARYQTAADLAADLRRYVDAKPILARRPTRWQHVRYWTRRNRALAATLLLLLAAMGALAVGGPLLAWRQARLTEMAERNLFISDLNLAYDAWHRGDVGRVEELLQKHPRRPTQGDSRDFAYGLLDAWQHAADDSILLERQERIDDIAVAPDGKSMAACGEFSGVLLVDPESRQLRRTLPTATDSVDALAFSPDSALLATAEGEDVTLWDAGAWTMRPQRLSHAATVTSLRFAPDGRTLAAATMDGDIAVWNRSGERCWSVQAHQQMIWRAEFSPDSRILATVSEDQHVKLWDAESGELKRDLARLRGPVFDVAWARGGQLLIVAGAEGIQYIDPGTGAQLRGLLYDVRPVASLAVHGNLLATGGHDHLLQFWDVDSGQRLGGIIAVRAQVLGLAFTADGQRIAAGGGDGTLRMFDVGQVRAYQRHVAKVDWMWPASVAITRDGSTCVSVAAPLAADQSRDAAQGEFIVWDAASATRRRSSPVAPRYGADVALSEDGRACASAGWGGVQLWDLGTAKPTMVLANDDSQRFWTAAVSPDGRWVAAAGYSLRAGATRHALLRLWDLKQPDAPREVPLPASAPGEISSLAFAADSQHFVVANGNWVQGTADVWTLVADKWQQTRPALGLHGQICTDAAFIPGAAQVATAGYDGMLGVRHVIDPSQSRAYRTHIQAIFSLAVAADGMLIATGGDREIRLWDRRTGDQLAAIQVPMWVSSLAFAADGNTLAWGGGDGSVNFLRTYANMDR